MIVNDYETAKLIKDAAHNRLLWATMRGDLEHQYARMGIASSSTYSAAYNANIRNARAQNSAKLFQANFWASAFAERSNASKLAFIKANAQLELPEGAKNLYRAADNSIKTKRFWPPKAEKTSNDVFEKGVASRTHGALHRDHLIAAAQAFSDILSTVANEYDTDEQRTLLEAHLPGFMLQHESEALFEVQRAVLGPMRDEQLRSMLLETVAQMHLHSTAAEQHRAFIVARALKSESHFVRDAAVTALLVTRGDFKVACQAAEMETIPWLSQRMKHVAQKLESGTFGLTFPQSQ